jgi:hypothetical protein
MTCNSSLAEGATPTYLKGWGLMDQDPDTRFYTDGMNTLPQSLSLLFVFLFCFVSVFLVFSFEVDGCFLILHVTKKMMCIYYNKQRSIYRHVCTLLSIWIDFFREILREKNICTYGDMIHILTIPYTCTFFSIVLHLFFLTFSLKGAFCLVHMFHVKNR